MNKGACMRPDSTETAEEEINLSDYIRIVRKRSILFFALFLCIIAGGTAYTLLTTPVYEAEIELEILDSPEEEMDILSSFTGLKRDRIETEIEKFRSRDIARSVVQRLRLDISVSAEQGNPDIHITQASVAGLSRSEPRVFYLICGNNDIFTLADSDRHAVAQSSEGTVSTSNAQFAIEAVRTSPGDTVRITVSHVESAVNTLMNRTSVSRIGDTDLIRIAVQHTCGETAVEITKAFADVYSQKTLRDKNTSARKINAFVSERRAFYKNKRLEASRRLQEFKRQHNLFSLETKNASLIKQMAEMKSLKAAKKVELDRITNAFEMVASGRRDSTTPEIFPPQSGLEQLSARLSMLRINRKKLLNSLTPDHPRVIETDIQIREIQQTIQNKLTATQETVKAELASIDRELAQYDEQVSQLPRLDRDMVEKIRDVKFYEEMELQMAKKAEEFTILEISNLSSVRISQKPVIPEKPVTPNIPISIVLTVITGIVCGLGIVFFAEYMDNTFDSAEDIEEYIGEDVMVVIPYIRKRFSRDVQTQPEESLAYLSADSPITESFRTLKTSLEFMDRGNRGRVFQVTSSVAGEGKSMISSNLAITFANSEVKTLLIDADYKKPMLDKILKCENRMGFVDMMHKELSMRETIQHTEIEHLDFIPSGLVLDSSMQSIHYEKFVPVLDELKQIYEYIIIDTPPLLAIDDSTRIGRIADGMIMVISLGNVDRNAARRCFSRCRNNGINIAGIVANDSQKTERYTKSYNYFNYYPYSSEKKRDRPAEKKWRIYLTK